MVIYRADAEDALRNLSIKYHQLTPASISDVLPDNYGLYTISFYNKTGIPSAEVRREFSKFGEVKNLTGSLDVKGGRVFVSYKEKGSAVAALQAFFFRKDRYPNMKFALPRCEKDYFGCYCLKFYNKSGDVTEEKVRFCTIYVAENSESHSIKFLVILNFILILCDYFFFEGTKRFRSIWRRSGC